MNRGSLMEIMLRRLIFVYPTKNNQENHTEARVVNDLLKIQFEQPELNNSVDTRTTQ